MANSIIGKITEIASEICEATGLILYDIEFVKEGKNKFLRVFIDKDEKGIFIDDCESFSRKMSELLDNRDIIPEAYTLEVSSPGLERKLSKDWHFEKVIGKKIDITLYAPLNGQKSITGRLTEYGNFLTIDELKIEKDKISSAKLHFEMEEQ